NQAWSGTMKQAAFQGKHATFANGRKIPPRWKIAKPRPLLRRSALRKTAGQQKDDFWRFSSELIHVDWGRLLTLAPQARISTSQPHHLRYPLAGGHERIKPTQAKDARVVFRSRSFLYPFKPCS